MPIFGSSTATGGRNVAVAGESENQHPRLKTLAGISLALISALSGCGREGPPLPPEIRVAERTTDLSAFQEGRIAILRWTYPQTTTDGHALTDIETIQVWRASLPLAQEPPIPLTIQDRQMRRQILENQGEIVQSLDPEQIAVATQGSIIVVEDDLDSWRQSEEDPESRVLWYGVRTVCCRHRESSLSNVVRLEPQAPPAPPTGLALEAGAAGIDVRWLQPPDVKILVERSPDGATWVAVTEEPVDGGEWRDTTAPQGRAWSYRLRSVRTVAAGGQVVGEPSAPVRIDHPDTYPPAAPTGVVCLPEGGRVRVRWQLVTGAEVYGVSRKLFDGPSELLAGDVTSVEFTDDTPPFGKLDYLVTAVDAAGNRSDPASCTVVMGADP
jgi:predicted small lipoprotein YifL